ncbi:TolC family protein [Chitinophaga pinensis]|uniref:Outer membrane efflux protein n=1 Tax=Chitinophaga pinensis (strain ATCC 43595 / DSM 2588 / LMG 13176 / NBRC 15968 / NCIMB 11800 / UQM 2034) TaxID=485918 RepID=A0A979GXI1_CHIPD|nr:TolC family protein [Chitinophaga pinensis]ACU61190.1 outer membrane efflux protein [Chitinophaga pinensis DSM 2588]
MSSKDARIAMFCRILLCCVLLLTIKSSVQAQDTLHITLQDAEKQFLEKNLQLLAEKYNVSIAQAEIIQAKLYNNPNLTLSGNLYNPDRKKFFDVSNQYGQYEVGIQQLISLAGKRNKQVQLARTDASMAENAFFDLLRTLRFTLRSNFYQAYYLQNSMKAYEEQISSLAKMDATYKDLQQKGLVTLKDAVRLRSLLYSLRADRTSMQNQLNDLQSEIQLLLQNNHAWFVLDMPEDAITGIPEIRQTSLQSLVDSAYANRQDLQLAQNNLRYNQQNYNLQKAMAVPDLTLGANFDKRGSFVDNATFLNVGIDLPFFNRNQVNIKAARYSMDQTKLLVQQQTQAVENEVQTAYAKAINTDKMLETVDPEFRGQFEQLLQAITDNFLKKNISLLELTDFYDSYKENMLQLNQLQNARMQAIETLNFAVGKTLFNNK